VAKGGRCSSLSVPSELRRLFTQQRDNPVGATTALIILVEMPELGDLNQRGAASLGLAPVARDSGAIMRKLAILANALVRDGRTLSTKLA